MIIAGHEGLSRPAISPGDSDLIIVGTEDQTEMKPNMLFLVNVSDTDKNFNLCSLLEIPDVSISLYRHIPLSPQGFCCGSV